MSEPKLNPAILSLLYDLDLLPEQIGDDTSKRLKMQSVIAHMTTTDPWQPISTAPLDGTHVLLIGEDDVMTVGFLDDAGGVHEAQIFYEILGSTHWRPLPEGPRQP